MQKFMNIKWLNGNILRDCYHSIKIISVKIIVSLKVQNKT